MSGSVRAGDGLARLCVLLVLAACSVSAVGCDWVDKIKHPASAPTASAPDAPRMYVTDRDKGFFGVSLKDSEVKETFPIAGGGGEVVCSADRKLVYATSPSFGHLMLFHSNGELLGRVPVGRHPYGLALSPDGRLAYVANQNTNDVSVVDLEKRQEVQRIPSGQGPYDVVVSDDGSRFYVTLQVDGALAAYDAATYKEVGRVTVGLAPYHVALDPDGRYIYVTAFDNDEIVVLRRDDLREVARVKVQDGPYDVVATRAGRIFATNIEAGTVSTFNRDAWEAVQHVPVGGRPSGLALSPEEDKVYVALEGDARVTIRSTVDVSEMSSFSVGTSPAEVFSGR